MSALAWAAKGGYDDAVTALIQHKAAVNPNGEDDTPPLFAAAGRGHRSTCSILLQAKADINAAYGDFGISILHHALDKKQPQLCSFLMDSKAYQG